MASRNELVVRAEAAGLDHENIVNDSVLEQAVLEAEKAPKPLTGGDRPSKLVRTGNGVKRWVTAPTKEELEEQVKASQEEKTPPAPDINRPAQGRNAKGHFTKG